VPEVRNEDATLFCEVEGDGEPVTVFAHGLTNNRNELAAFTPLVAGTKVRFDFRGHGRSSSPADPKASVSRTSLAIRRGGGRLGATVAVGTCSGRARSAIVCRQPHHSGWWLLPAGLDLPFGLANRYHLLAEDLEGDAAGGARDRTQRAERVASTSRRRGARARSVMWQRRPGRSRPRDPRREDRR
jgi:pimeloyl-ACP methyl ester carboxylesterase